MHDEGPAHRTGPDATPSPRSSPKVTSSGHTVSPKQLRDPQGRLCLEVRLPVHIDERAGACVFIQPDRCLHLLADPDTSWTRAGLQRIAWRTALRTPLVFDALPAELGDALAAELLAWIDFLSAAA